MIDFKKKISFTLVELLIVVIILSILAALALPRFLIVIERVKSSEGVQILTALLGAQKRYFLENGVYKDGTGASQALVSGDLDVYIAPTSNFNPIRITNVANVLAEVTRSSLYSLKIDSSGVVSCHYIAGNTSCLRLGYGTANQY